MTNEVEPQADPPKGTLIDAWKSARHNRLNTAADDAMLTEGGFSDHSASFVNQELGGFGLHINDDNLIEQAQSIAQDSAVMLTHGLRVTQGDLHAVACGLYFDGFMAGVAFASGQTNVGLTPRGEKLAKQAS